MNKTLSIYEGTHLTFTLPSGKTATIREHAAIDDDTLTAGLSKYGGSVMVKNFNNYVAGILIELDGSKKITVGDVENLLLVDKHYIMLKSRIHSIGETMDILHSCQGKDCNTETEYEIDLSVYDDDLSNPITNYTEDDELRIRPKHISEPYFEIETPSKRKVRLDYLTGKGENYVLQQTKTGNLKASADILSRFPKVEVDGEWVEVKNVNVFSKKDIITLKKAVSDHDKQFSLTADVVCPHCGLEDTIPLILVKDFFFPEEI